MKVTVHNSIAVDGQLLGISIESDEPTDNHPVLDKLLKTIAVTEKVVGTDVKLPALVTVITIKENVLHIGLAVSVSTQFKTSDEFLERFLQAVGQEQLPKNINKLSGSEVMVTLRNMDVIDFERPTK